MLDPIAEAVEAALKQYANYRESQLLAAGDIEACFVRVIARLRSMARRAVWFGRFVESSIILFIAWLAYRSGVRGDLTALLCVAPISLLMLLSQTKSVAQTLQSLARLETLAGLWRDERLLAVPCDPISTSTAPQPETPVRQFQNQ